MILKLALRNLWGAGVRTWLNAIVLSLSFFTIIWSQGVYHGMQVDATRNMIAMELGGGQYRHPDWDPYDPLTLPEAHGAIPAPLQKLIVADKAVALLLAQGTIYPDGRPQAVLLKGIAPEQQILELPPIAPAAQPGQIPVMIGREMSESLELGVGELLTLRWRDHTGAFDAREFLITTVFSSSVPTIDRGHIWLRLADLQVMLSAPGIATLVVVSPEMTGTQLETDWVFRSQDYLLADLRAMVRSKSAGAAIMYALLLFLALIAVFDTQVLSLFRRRREMGTLMALGLTRGALIRLFTLEGALHGVLAGLLALVYGWPIVYWTAVTGFALPQASQDFQFAIGDRLYPVYTLELVLVTTLLVLVTVTIVSYLPTRRISHLNPVDALRGRRS
ncbi:MAG: FtsX-like permease family protein [Candidatus Delongbacteria bacterium]|nr:FtsX-like permease family protein [Candidatus Delongbacteria bacterium]